MKTFRIYSSLALVAMLLLLAVTAHAQDEGPTPTPTPTATPAGSVEEVYRLDSGNYVVIDHSFSYGELTTTVILLILLAIVLRSNQRGKAS